MCASPVLPVSMYVICETTLEDRCHLHVTVGKDGPERFCYCAFKEKAWKSQQSFSLAGAGIWSLTE